MIFSAVDIGDSLQRGLDGFFGFLPNVIGFLVILLIGYFIAKAVKTLITKGLQKLGLDKQLHSSAAGQYVEKASPGASPSKLVGAIAFWFIFLFAVSAAVGALKIAALTSFIAQVQSFLPNVIVAVIIFVVAAAIAGAVGGLVHKTMGDTPTGKIVRAVVPGLVLAIGTFMVLDQLQIAPVIVTITYGALIGMLALAGALAFGLGGRDVARDMLQSAVQSGKENKDQVQQDLQTGKARGEQQARQQSGEFGGSSASTPSDPATTRMASGGDIHPGAV